MINFNKRIVIIIVVLLTLVFGLRKQDIGMNDWVYENIGEIQQLSFDKPHQNTHYSKKVLPTLTFFNSKRGIFGKLNKSTGQLIQRQSLATGQSILQYSTQQIIILTSHKQIIRYNQLGMNKYIDNRFINQDFNSINSYIIFQDKLYLADNQTIKQYQTNIKILNSSTIPIPSGFTILKLFVTYKQQSPVLYSALYNKQHHQLCLGNIFKHSSKSCIAVQPQFSLYLKAMDKTGHKYQYFQLNQHHSIIQYHQPSSFYQSGIVLQSDGGIVNAIKTNTENKQIQAYIMSTKQPVHIQHQQHSQYISLYTASSQSKGTKLLTIDIAHRGEKIKKLWIDQLLLNTYEIVIQFQDLQLVYFDKQQSTYKQIWSRQQSLAYIQQTVFLKYSGYTDHLNNPYHLDIGDPLYRRLNFGDKLQQVPINMFKRIKTQIEDLYTSIGSTINKSIQLLSKLQSFSQLSNIKNLMKFGVDEDRQKRYGLQKYFIAITSLNTIISIDTKTSKINWKKKLPNGYKPIKFSKLDQQYQQQIAILISFNKQINQTVLTSIHQNGHFTQLAVFQTSVQPTAYRISSHSALIKSGQNVYKYDSYKNLTSSTEKQYHFFSIQDKKVIGWKIFQNQVIKTWSIQLPQSQKIIKSASVYRSQPSSNFPIVNHNSKVIFKNVDFSNLAILTLQQHLHQTEKSVKIVHRLHLYIINGLTGTIQFSQYQTLINPNLPINLFYDQHNAIVSYYSNRNRVCQFWTIQAFQIPQQTQLLTKKYQPQLQKQDIVFRSKVFGIVLPIKHVFVSQSKQALLRRNILIVTRQNKVYTLSRQLISTRRPKPPQSYAPPTQLQFTNPKYQPDDYILPINPLSYLTHNRKLIDLHTIHFSSSDMESTIFILSYGLDIFLMRTAPDKPFDMLDDSFNYVQILAVILVVTIAALFLRTKVKNARLQKFHLQ